MRRSGTINLLLLAVAVILGIVVWMTPEKEAEQTTTPLTQMLPDTISHIRIENHTGPAFILERAGEHWQMTQPYQIEANTPRINILLVKISRR